MKHSSETAVVLNSDTGLHEEKTVQSLTFISGDIQPVNEKDVSVIISTLKVSQINEFDAVMIAEKYRENRWGLERFKKNYQISLERSSNSFERVKYLLAPTSDIKLYDYQAYCLMCAADVKLEPVKIDKEIYFVRPENLKYFDESQTKTHGGK